MHICSLYIFGGYGPSINEYLHDQGQFVLDEDSEVSTGFAWKKHGLQVLALYT